MNEEESTVFVGNLTDSATTQALYAHFITFGQIKSIYIPKETQSGRQRGFAFIHFDEPQDAMAAIDNYDKSEWLGRVIAVRRARRQELKSNYNKAVWSSEEWLQENNRREEAAAEERRAKEQKDEVYAQ